MAKDEKVYGRTLAEWEELSQRTVIELAQVCLQRCLEVSKLKMKDSNGDDQFYRSATLGIAVRLAAVLCQHVVAQAVDSNDVNILRDKIAESISEGVSHGVNQFYEKHPELLEEIIGLANSPVQGNG